MFRRATRVLLVATRVNARNQSKKNATPPCTFKTDCCFAWPQYNTTLHLEGLTFISTTLFELHMLQSIWLVPGIVRAPTSCTGLAAVNRYVASFVCSCKSVHTPDVPVDGTICAANNHEEERCRTGAPYITG